MLFAFFLPLSERISTILILLTLIALAVEFIQGSLQPKGKRALWILPLYFLVYAIAVIVLSEDHQFKWFEQRASLLAFPLIFYAARDINYRDVLRFFVWGCVLAYLLCLVNAVSNSLTISEGELLFKPLVNDSRGFFEAIMYEGNYFFGEHFSALMQTSYFGFYLTMSAVFILVYKKSIFIEKWWNVLLVFLLIGVIQTMSLAAYGGIFAASLLLIFFLIKERKIRIAAYLLIAFIMLVGYFAQPRFKAAINRVADNGITLDPAGRYGVVLRLLSWDAALELIKENYLLGVGPPDAQEELNKKYREKGYIYPEKNSLNCHSQFFQTTLEIGIFGTLLLVGLFVFLAQKAMRVPAREKVVIVVFSSLLFLNFGFESYFNRYIGLAFVCFFYCLFISIEEQKRVHGAHN